GGAGWVPWAPAGEPGPVTGITVAVPAASITAAAPATSAWRLARPERTSKEVRSDIQITPAVLTAASRTGLEPDGWTGNVWFAPGMAGSGNRRISFSAASSCALVPGSRGNLPFGTEPRAEG